MNKSSTGDNVPMYIIKSLFQNNLYILHICMPFLIYWTDFNKWGIDGKVVRSTLIWCKNKIFFAKIRALICEQRFWAFYRDVLMRPFLHERNLYLSPLQWYIYFFGIRLGNKVITKSLEQGRDFVNFSFFQRRWKTGVMWNIQIIIVLKMNDCS